MERSAIAKKYDVVVVGGGMSGLIAAVASARHGAKTALVHNRPVLGGNASSEIRMHICGADCHASRPDSRETGILEEILLKNKKRNPNHSYPIFDTVLWELATYEPGLELFLNTQMTDVKTENGEIKSILASQLTTEKAFEFSADIFIDATGDATLSFLSGAETTMGRESKEVYGEKFAPDQSDSVTMGSSLMFKAVETAKPVHFEKPWWANTYTEEDLVFRNHDDFSSGYWWIELGGDRLNTIDDAEQLRDELLKAIYGIWDHIKNSGLHNADCWDLEWVGILPGKRESRRVIGDYVLREQDCFSGRVFEDAVAYGGWPMDMHVMGGLTAKYEPTTYLNLKQVYTIPYRSLYSKNIGNLMIAGRAISTSHMAFGSTRVMATCSVVGQAAGTAAALAATKHLHPRDLLPQVKELQQALIRDDCYIPGYKNDCAGDLAKTAAAACSSAAPGEECENLLNGVTRKVGEAANSWSPAQGDADAWISLRFEKEIAAKEIHFKFDSNLSRELTISLSRGVQARQAPGVPPELVKDYRIEFYRQGSLVHTESVKDNFLRFRVHKLQAAVRCDQIKVRFTATNGCERARVFEIRVYE